MSQLLRFSDVLTFALFFLSLNLTFGQSNDCAGAQFICSDGAIAFNPSGVGVNDFSVGSNSAGCINLGEQNSAWYFFTFREDMPDDSVLEFVIDPDGGSGEDYDFALYGPNRSCNTLGGPVRCSWAGAGCAQCPLTGLGGGATDNSEDAFGDGFVAPLTVQPGQSYFLMVDNFSGTGNGFILTWGGSAAPFLDCSPPDCDFTVIASDDITACASDGSVDLFALALDAPAGETYFWTAEPPAASAFLSSPFSPNPTVNIPDGYFGTIFYTVQVAVGPCVQTERVRVVVNSSSSPNITGDLVFCQGELGSLNAGSGFSSYQWSTGEITQSITIDRGGLYSVTVDDGSGCPTNAFVIVDVTTAPAPVILGDPRVCEGVSTTLTANSGFSSYQWSNGSSSESIEVDEPGLYSVTVTNAGCEGVTDVLVVDDPGSPPVILGDPTVCVGKITTLTVPIGMASYEWSDGTTTREITIRDPGTYTVTTVDIRGCENSSTIEVLELPTPSPIIDGNLNLCAGAGTNLDAGAGFQSYEWTNVSTGQTSGGQILQVGAPGTYELIVTNANGCIGFTSVEVNEVDAPVPEIVGELGICPGEQTELTANATFATYQWSDNSSSESLSVTDPGTYSLTVTDGNGCRGSVEVEVLQKEVPVPQIIGEASICPGEQTTLSVDSGFASYQWSNSQSNFEINVGQAGNYMVTVTNADGCEGVDEFILDLSPEPAPIITGVTQICVEGSTVLDAGGGFNSYNWSNGLATQTINLNQPGDYTVSVTNVEGCVGETTVTVSNHSVPSPNITGDLEICDGETTDLSVANNFETYQWSNNSTEPQINANVGGVFSVTVTDTNGCLGETSVDLTVNANPVVNINGVAEYCEGESTSLSASDNFTNYLWSDGSTDATLNVSSPGTYSLVVTDDNGCSGQNQIDIVENALPEPEIEGRLVFCIDGSTTVQVSESFASYQWSNNNTDQSIEISTAGTYSVTVTNDNGCEGEANVNVEEIASLTPQIFGDLAFCTGLTTDLRGEEGFSSYQWSTGENIDSVTVGIAGLITLSVVDENGCTGSSSVTLTENPLPQPNITGSDYFCTGTSTNLSVSNNFTSIAWSTNETSASITVGDVGQYEVSVTDENSCIGTTSLNVIERALPQPQILGEPQFCPGTQTTLSADRDYTSYQWTDGSGANSFTVSSVGTQTLTVIDEFGCAGNTNIEVSNFVTATPDIQGPTLFCPEGNTTLDAGIGFVTYNWGDGFNNQTITVSNPGTYGVTVTDQNGCLTEENITVTNFDVVDPVISGDFAFCTGTSTTIQANGAFQTYEWSTNTNGASVTVNQPGVYEVQATDLNGCLSTASVEIIENALPTPEISGPDYICAGTTTNLNVTGPGLFNNIVWSTNENTPTITTGVAGQYQVVVTDGNGCEGMAAFDLLERVLPQPQIQGEALFCPGTQTMLFADREYASLEWSNGLISDSIVVNEIGTQTLTVTDEFGCIGSTNIEVGNFVTTIPDIQGPTLFCPEGTTTLDAGATFVNYIWDDGLSSRTNTVTTAGTYSVTVTDQNGCITDGSITVANFEVTPPTISGDFAFCTGTNTAIQANSGYQSYEWSNNQSGATLTVNQPGIYEVEATDLNGCLSNASVEVIENTLPTPEITGRNTFCNGNPITIGVEESFVGYSWSTGSAEANISVSVEAVYTVTVTDGNGCEGETQLLVTEASELEPEIEGELAFCEGLSTTLAVSETFATYQWSNNIGTQSQEINQAGTYSVTVTDEGGCVGETLVDVTMNPLPSPTLGGVPYFCTGLSTNINVSESFASYNWSTGSTDNAINVQNPGDITVEVTDINGCIATTSLNIEERPLPEFQIQGQDFFCENANTSLNVNQTFSTYAWSNGNASAEVTIDQADIYSVTVTDEFGCQNNRSINIEQIALPIADAGFSQTLTCTDQSFAIGGELSDLGDVEVQFIWSGPGITQDLENLPHPEVNVPGLYTLQVLNTTHNCISEPATVNINLDTLRPVVALQVLDQITCTVSTVLVDGSSSDQGIDFNYQWFGPDGQLSTGDTENTLVANRPGSYALMVENIVTGCAAVDSIEVEENIEYPNATIANPEILNCERTETILDGSGSAAGNNVVYEWSTPSGSIAAGFGSTNVLVNAPGTYVINVSDVVNGCMNSDTVEVLQDIRLPIANAGEDQFIDCHSVDATLNGSNSSNGANFSYQWQSSNNDDFSGVMSSTIVVSRGGAYTLTVRNLENGCTAVDQVIVTEDESAPTDLVLDTKNPTCFGDSDGAIAIQEVIGGDGPFIYSINGGVFNSRANFANLPSGNYDVLVQDADGCELSIAVNLAEGYDLELDLGEDQTIKLGEEATIDAFVNIPNVAIESLSWTPLDSLSVDCNDCLSRTVQPFETTSYTLNLLDENGCRINDRITIFVANPQEIFLPNAFSPNNDGVNDVFMPFTGSDVAKINSLLIFNRWGEPVYERYNFAPNDPQYGWDGKFRARPMNAAVFVYMTEVEFINGETKLFKGDVALIR